jgi:alanine-alpha-ketoisovalerate/valine-pyruvate aminotransferase
MTDILDDGLRTAPWIIKAITDLNAAGLFAESRFGDDVTAECDGFQLTIYKGDRYSVHVARPFGRRFCEETHATWRAALADVRRRLREHEKAIGWTPPKRWTAR